LYGDVIAGLRDRYLDYPLKVVGESYRQDALEAIVEEGGLDDGRVRPAGGVGAILKSLLDGDPHGDAPNLDGRTIAAALASRPATAPWCARAHRRSIPPVASSS